MHKRLSNTHFGFGSVMSLELPMPELGVEMPEPIEQVQRPTEPKQRFRDAVVSRLTSAKVNTEELRQMRAELLGEVFDGAVNLNEVDSFLEACEDEEQHALIEKHREIREKGREQLAIVEQMAIKFGEANATWNGLAVERDKSQFNLKVMLERQKNLGQFASDSQMRSADIRVVEARKRNEEAWNSFGSAMTNMNSCGSELEAARVELQRIREQEQTLRSQILGEPYNDPELGLEVNPGGAN